MAENIGIYLEEGQEWRILLQLFLPVEVCDNDGDGKGDAEHSTDGAQRGNKLPSRSPGGNVTVSSAGHGDDGPVQGLG